jgi:hypothetical protein
VPAQSKIYIHTLSVSAAEPGARSMKWVKNVNLLACVLRRGVSSVRRELNF